MPTQLGGYRGSDVTGQSPEYIGRSSRNRSENFAFVHVCSLVVIARAMQLGPVTVTVSG